MHLLTVGASPLFLLLFLLLVLSSQPSSGYLFAVFQPSSRRMSLQYLGAKLNLLVLLFYGCLVSLGLRFLLRLPFRVQE